MSDQFALKKNVVMTIVAFAANILLTFISYRLVIVGGGLEVLGLWSTLMAWIYIIRLGDVGMASAAMRYVSRCDTSTEGQRIRTYVDTGLMLNGSLFLGLAVAGYFGFSQNMSVIVPSNEVDRALATSILPLMLLGFLVSNLSGLVLGALRGIHLGYLAAWITIAGTLLQLVLVVWLVPDMGLAGLALGQVAQHVGMLLVGWFMFWRKLGEVSGASVPIVPICFSWNALREMFGFSVKAQIANLANGFFEPLAKILIGRFAGLEALGLFEMAYKLVSLPRNAAVSGVQATIPAVTRLLASDRSEANRLYAKMARAVLQSAGLLAVISILVSPFVSWLTVGHVDYTLTVFVALISVGFFGNTIGAPAFTLGMATGQMRYNIMSAFLAMAVMASICIILGTQGAADWLLIAAVAVGLVAGGLFIKWRNETFLKG